MAIGRRLSADAYVAGVLAGDKLVLSRAITLVESTLASDQQLAAEVLARLPQRHDTFRLGITGVPGVGKSSFIESFGRHVLAQGKRLAVLAVDPSSPVSHGSILGDKTRMETLSADPRAYVRPSPTGEALGGISLRSRDAITLCEAAGYDFVIVETVGVGQSETTVHQVTDFFLLLMLAGAGDELQGIKRGIMELADAIVITKADGENVNASQLARATYLSALHLLPPAKPFWTPPVTLSSVVENKGIAEVYDLLQRYRQEAETTDWFVKNRRQQGIEAMHEYMQFAVLRKFYEREDVRALLPRLEASLLAGEAMPVGQLLSLIGK